MKAILRYPGAKWNLANWIVHQLPSHKTYLEPYFGSGAVFFNKKSSPVETINDIDSRITNLFRILRQCPDELAKTIEMTPWAREEYQSSEEPTDDQVEKARRFIVRCWMAIGSNTDHKTGWKSAVSGTGRSSYAKDWSGVPERIRLAAQRLKQAQIENMPAVELILRYRRDDVLIYADPPYVMSTRTQVNYANEMGELDHRELLETLDNHPGPVLISGYACELYDNRLTDWTRKTTKAIAEGGKEREEVLWLNAEATKRLGMTLF